MSYRIVFREGTDEPVSFSLATTADWGSFIQWVEGLPKGGREKFETLRGLVNSGYASNTFKLSRELKKARRASPPEPGSGLAIVIKELMKILGVGSEDESASVVSYI
jgi:hypothetical protein